MMNSFRMWLASIFFNITVRLWPYRCTYGRINPKYRYDGWDAVAVNFYQPSEKYDNIPRNTNVAWMAARSRTFDKE